MPVRHSAQPLVRDLFTAEARAARGGRPAVGMFLSSGDSTAAEICAGAGMDYLLIDGEHAPLSLETVLAQLRTIAGYGVTVMTRVPALDAVLVKQYLDLGAQTVLVPMVDGPEQAAEAVRHVSLFVQIETAAGVENARAIAETDGVDGIFVGPSDLSASMGLIGQQTHPDVVAAVQSVIAAANAVGTVVGVNAFVEAQARAYAEAGADFVNVAPTSPSWPAPPRPSRTPGARPPRPRPTTTPGPARRTQGARLLPHPH